MMTLKGHDRGDVGVLTALPGDTDRDWQNWEGDKAIYYPDFQIYIKAVAVMNLGRADNYYSSWSKDTCVIITHYENCAWQIR
jgi:hypothetical protein